MIAYVLTFKISFLKQSFFSLGNIDLLFCKIFLIHFYILVASPLLWTQNTMNEFNQSSVNFSTEFIQDFNYYSFESFAFYKKINLISTCAFISFGLLGHSLTIFVFIQKKFRTNSRLFINTKIKKKKILKTYHF